MQRRKFNMIVSASAFLLGCVYMFTDKAGITANVIGSTSTNAGMTAFYGMLMIMGAVGLFIVNMHDTGNRSIDLERLVRRSKDHTDLNAENIVQQGYNHSKER